MEKTLKKILEQNPKKPITDILEEIDDRRKREERRAEDRRFFGSNITDEEFAALTEEGKRLADERAQAEEIEKITKNVERRIEEISGVAEKEE